MSSHQWSVFGDATQEASSLARQKPVSVRISSRAATLIPSCTSWGFVPAKNQADNADNILSGSHEQRDTLQQLLRHSAKRCMDRWSKKPMPSDAIAYGQTVLSKHQFVVWTPVSSESPPLTRSTEDTPARHSGGYSAGMFRSPSRKHGRTHSESASLYFAQDILSKLCKLKMVVRANLPVFGQNSSDESLETSLVQIQPGMAAISEPTLQLRVPAFHTGEYIRQVADLVR